MPLDQNHSHFILRDSAETTNSDDMLRQEVLFRVKLELELRNGWSSSVKESVLERQRRFSKISGISLTSAEAIAHEANTAIPSIVICINGQFDSLLMVKESLREKVYVLIFAVTSELNLSHFI